MATASYVPVPKWHILDSNGIPMAAGKVYTYLTGSATPANLYSDSAGTAHAWPLILDSGGRATVFMGAGNFKVVICDSDDVEVWNFDPVSAAGAGAGGSGIMLTVNTLTGASNSLKALTSGSALFVEVLGYATLGDGGGGSFYYNSSSTGDDDGIIVKGTDAPATGRWIRLFGGKNIDPRWYGAKGTGSDNDTAAFVAANTYAAANGYDILVPAGNFLWSTNPALTVPLQFESDGMITWSSFSPVIDPIITDTEQHFSITASATDYPKFPSGTLVDPRWFGVTADGATNDTVPMQAAFLAASNGGSIVLSDGTFLVGESAPTQATLMLTNNVEVYGKGRHSILKFRNGYATDYGLLGNSGTDLENVHIHDLTIDGNRSGQTSGGYGIKTYGRNCLIENVFVHDCSSIGIYLGQVGDTTGHSSIVECTVTDSSTACIAVDGLRDCRIYGNSIYGGDITGITVSDCTRLVISENKIYGTKGYGIKETGSDTTYGLNYISGVTTKYSDSTNRFIDIGSALNVQLNGDTTVSNTLRTTDMTVVNNATIENNLTVNGNIINSAFYNLMGSLISGLDLTCTDSATAWTAKQVTIKPGSCMLMSAGEPTGYITTLATEKTISIDGTWQYNDGSNALASACYPADASSWYHLFAMGDVDDNTNISFVIDSDPRCANGLADAVTWDSTLTQYRRIAEIYHLGKPYLSSTDYGIARFIQKGNEFRFRGALGGYLNRHSFGAQASTSVVKLNLSDINYTDGGTGCPSIQNGVYITPFIAEEVDSGAFGDGNTDYADYYFDGTHSCDPTYSAGQTLFLQTDESCNINWRMLRAGAASRPTVYVHLKGWRDERNE